MLSATVVHGESSRGPRWDRSARVSKVGTHYWEFSWPSSTGQWSDASMPVWGSELAGFISTLDSLAAMELGREGWPNEGPCPLKSLLTASGGLLWCISAKRDELSLV